jgi:hypothetical protein
MGVCGGECVMGFHAPFAAQGQRRRRLGVVSAAFTALFIGAIYYG